MASALVSVFLVVAASIVVSNWWLTIKSRRNVRKGVARHHSMVPLVAQILVLMAAIVERRSGAVISVLLFWTIALSDLSFWVLLSMPVFVLRRRLRSRKSLEHGRFGDQDLSE